MLNQINIVHEDLRIVQAFKRVQQIIGSISTVGGGNAGIDNVLFVDLVTGNDFTAQVGSLVNKFATIQGAFNKIIADGIPNRVVSVSPGVYNGNLIWPSINNVTLQGSGENNTFVGSVGANPTLLFNSVSTVATAEVKDISIRSLADKAISIDGTFSGGASFSNILSIQNVDLGSGTNQSFYIKDVNNVIMNNVKFGQGTIENVSFFVGQQLLSIFGNGTLITNFDPTLSVPSNPKVGYLLDSSIIQNLIVNNIANILATSSCEFNNGITANLIDTVLDNGRLDVRSNTGFVAVSFNHNNGDHTIANFDLAKINGSFSIVNAGGVNRGKVTAKNAVFVDSSKLITAGNLTDIDIKGAQFVQGQLNPASTGTIDRSIHRTLSPVPGPGGVPVPIVPPFTNFNYTVSPELFTVDAIAGLIVGFGAKTNAGFTAVSNIPSVAPVEFCAMLGN